ncbi:MAG: hypothetical protein H0U74_17660 [Bradymonadaceae bacterium]|nr:hypothetical protein [Lujinxingiaceae bacterium]
MRAPIAGRARAFLLATITIASLLSVFATAALASGPSATSALKRANDAYNQSRYDEARDGFIEAIQAEPHAPDAYRNLARTYFWQNDYSSATAYYDLYMRLAAEAADLEQVRAERRLAATRAGDQIWQMPEGQRLALKALGDELDEGRAYTAGGGGAWGLYRTLLRMQFAQPELAQLRRRLVRRLLDEYEGLMVPQVNQLAPLLDLEDWKVQRERLRAARTLTNDEAMLDVLRRREMIVEAAEALLLGRYPAAATLAESAASENADIAFLHWYRIAALIYAGRHALAMTAVEELGRRLLDAAPAQLDYARIVRAAVLQASGKHDDAAGIYLDLLSK